jgi:hypothetical protein
MATVKTNAISRERHLLLISVRLFVMIDHDASYRFLDQLSTTPARLLAGIELLVPASTTGIVIGQGTSLDGKLSGITFDGGANETTTTPPLFMWVLFQGKHGRRTRTHLMHFINGIGMASY